MGSTYSFPAPVPKADCGPGARPETAAQGRVPQADYDSGRAARGYQCNARQVSHHGSSGGFKVQRYTDAHGNTCAFYDSTLLFPRDAVANAASGTGVIVLDMNDPAHPRQTANLVTPAMQSPHETLLLNPRRGLLAGVLGTAATYPGDPRHLRRDAPTAGTRSCSPRRRPASSATSPAGRPTARRSGAAARSPRWSPSTSRTPGCRSRSSPSSACSTTACGSRPTAASCTPPTSARRAPPGSPEGGLRILDVSQVQDRKPNPQVTVLSDLTWRELSIPQVAEPFTRNGHRYLLEVDEFTDLFSFSGLTDPVGSPVGAARIINIDDPRHPRVVSNIRLKVHQPAARRGAQKDDPGAAFPAQGYAAHYCSTAATDEPGHRRLLDDPVRAAALRHPRRAEPEGGRLLQPAADARHEALVPERRGRLRDVPAGVGPARAARSGTPTRTPGSTSSGSPTGSAGWSTPDPSPSRASNHMVVVVPEHLHRGVGFV